MKGYRAHFFIGNPILQSIEILTWASQHSCFMMAEVKEAFAEQYEAAYGNFDHEISERLRKLLKGGMIAIADEGYVSSQEKLLVSRQLSAEKQPSQEEVVLTADRIATIRQKLAEMASEKRGRGRPPRLYITTKAADRYVETRAVDFVFRAQELEPLEGREKAAELIHSIASRMIQENRPEDLDRALFSVELHGLSTNIMVSLLRITLPVASTLPCREQFLKQSTELAKARGEYVPELFK